MLAQIPLVDPIFLDGLCGEFRRDVRRLLLDLCDELEGAYRRAAVDLALPVDYFRWVADAVKPEDWGGWKSVGWVEELNDLVYFIDLREQWGRARDRRAFAEALRAECEEQFYENSYQEDLFPEGTPAASWLGRRLDRLCGRLARQVVQEALFLVPGLPCAWLATRGGRPGRCREWRVPCSLAPNFELAELGACLSIGLEGAYLEPPAPLRRVLRGPAVRTSVLIRERDVRLRAGWRVIPVMTAGDRLRWHWRYVPARSLGFGEMTLGEVLVYGKDGTAARVVKPPRALPDRVRRALDVIDEAWPAGAANLRRLTARIVPLKARGVVSFSYRHRPGLSFINCFDRDQLDLIDDLIHENSHHHLNLLLRKFRMRRGDRNREVFYSPWRRSLRPLHGILHATFTFTMGALLFERLSAWGTGRSAAALRRFGLTERDLLRARFRCLEEVESVRYAIRDLRHAAVRLGWLTPAGTALVDALDAAVGRVVRRSARHRRTVLRSSFGPPLRRHLEVLRRARATYPLPRC